MPRMGRKVVLTVLPAMLATVALASPAAARIVPFEKVGGVRLGMTLPQAKATLGPGCPTLTRRTRRLRAHYDCYFDVFPGGAGWQELTYTRRGDCGADVDLHARRSGATRRAMDIDTTCADSFADGVGVGSSFHDMYAEFPAGTVRCLRRGEDNLDVCFAQRLRHGEIRLTVFEDDDFAHDYRVHHVGVRKCTSVTPSPPAGAKRFMPCTKTFLTTQARVRGEFTP